MRVAIHPVTCTVALAMVAMSAPCAAQTKVDVTPFVGVGVYPLTTFSPACGQECPAPHRPDSFDAIPTGGVEVGARLTTRLTKRLAFDFSVSGWEAHGSTTWGASPGLLFDILSSPHHASLFIVGGVSVATLGGPAAPGGLVGAYDFAMPTQTVWGPVLGVGARVPLSPTLALRLEVEDYLYRPTDVGGEVSALVFSVGPSVTLGGRRTPASDAWGVTDH
jgi:hypothetical protein